MQDFDNTSEVKDLPNRREFLIWNNKYILERFDPYGFWNVHVQHGQIPKELKGNYTSPDEARRAITTYLSKKGKSGLIKKDQPEV